MNVTNAKSLNVQTEELNSKSPQQKDGDVKFSDELKNVKSAEKTEQKQDTEMQEKEVKTDNNKDIEKNIEIDPEIDIKKDIEKTDNSEEIFPKDNGEDVGEALIGLKNTIDVFFKINQKDETEPECIKNLPEEDDIKNKNEDSGLIDNNVNVPEQQDKINLQMGANMSFNSNGQPFAEFVNNEQSKDTLKSSAKDLAEEKAIMSTMEENIAIANKNMALSKTKTVENEHGVHKIDKKTNLIVDTIVSYDNVIMTKDDVDFFTNLVENGVVEMSEVKNAQKSSHVSKTLADMLAKAMNDNKPVRIDFDNNISVIIKIDRAGKISADFIPSSQVAEAYLKENLPLLKQRFDDNNIDYKELNQRQRKQQDTQDNRKKGRKNE